MRAARESRTPSGPRAEAWRRSPHKYPAPQPLPRTTASRASLRVPPPALRLPTIRWHSASHRPPESFSLRPLVLPPGPCALRFPACVAPPHKPARHIRLYRPARAPIPRTPPAGSSVASGQQRLSPSVGPWCAHRRPAAADLRTTPCAPRASKIDPASAPASPERTPLASSHTETRVPECRRPLPPPSTKALSRPRSEFVSRPRSFPASAAWRGIHSRPALVPRFRGRSPPASGLPLPWRPASPDTRALLPGRGRRCTLPPAEGAHPRPCSLRYPHWS